jgi:lysophospholipase L1-like esterase
VLSGLEVLSSMESAAVVVLGNSIADGRGSGTDQNDRWPDNLARRLQGNPATAHVAVLNAGIGGNAVLRGGLGPTGLSRLERDVLAQARARWLIVSEGVNDIGTARGDSSESIALQLTAGYRDIIRRARARHILVYGATILPFGGSMYSSPEHEAARAAVNTWIRQSGAFDAVIDLDAAMRDPANPARLRPDADGGDHLHPNERGYRQMADAFDLALFTTKR